MKPRDFTLLAIALASNPIQPVQLQKALFLLSRKTPTAVLGDEAKYDFKPYDYGPFSAEIYNDVDELEAGGWVSVTRPPWLRYKLYAATEGGLLEAEKRAQEMPSQLVEFLRRLVQYTQSLTFNQLVSSVYEEFPEMKANSVFKETK
jgi:uncharacterized protein YwgA